MVGFTLEERVGREWHRRQAAVGSGLKLAGSISQSSNSTEADAKASNPGEGSATPPKRPLMDHTILPQRSDNPSLTVPLPGESVPSAQTQILKSISSFPLGLVTNSSKSSLDDWDVLEPSHPSRSTLTDQVNARSPSRQCLLQESSLSDFDSLSTVSSSPREEGCSELPCVPFTVRALHGCESSISLSNGGYLGHHAAHLPCTKGKQRATCKTEDDLRFSAIHKRPLPTPPSCNMSTNADVSIDASSSY